MQFPAMQAAINNADWISPAEVKLNKNDLPGVPGFHVVVRPVTIRDQTKGGIYLPDKVKDDISYLTTVGQVVLAVNSLNISSSSTTVTGAAVTKVENLRNWTLHGLNANKAVG